MHRIFLLIVAVLHLGIASAQGTDRKKCNSGLKGDFQYEACGSFCKATSASKHCAFCKCKQCSYCQARQAKAIANEIAAEEAEATGASSAKPKGAAPPLQREHHNEEVGQLVAQYAAATPSTTATQEASSRSSILLIALGIGIGCALAHVLAFTSFALTTTRADNNQAAEWTHVGDAENGEGQALTPAPATATVQQPVSATAGELRTRALCVAFLCVQYAAYALLRRYATGILREEWSMASVLGVGELIKFLVSLAAIRASTANSEAPEGPLSERVSFLLRHSGKMAVPAGLYLAMNMLGFVALRRVDAGTFAIVQQTKAFFTALFQRALLSRSLSMPKWCALTLLVLGVTLISLQAQPNATGCGPLAAAPALPAQEEATAPAGSTATALALAASSYAIGVLAVTADSALSGYATVYFERVLKTTVLTVWDRNLQLSFWSMLIYGPWAIFEHPTAPLHGWSRVTVLLALLGALGGILVALVIKHADGVAKSLSTASSIVLTTGASYFLFQGPMSSAIVLGSCIVVVAGYTYQKVS